MKYSELKEDDKNKINEAVNRGVALTGQSEAEWDGFTFKVESTLGLCNSCEHLILVKSEYGNIFAKCDELGLRLSGNNRISECTMFIEKGKLTLTEMKQMATLIDDKKKTIVGF